MNRDPIAVLIKLAAVKVGYARAEHTRAEAAVSSSDRAIRHLQHKIAAERDHQETGSGMAMGLSERGVVGLFNALKTAQALKIKLEDHAAETRHRLSRAILAEERYAIHQKRLQNEKNRTRQRQAIAIQDDLHRARLHRKSGLPGTPG